MRRRYVTVDVFTERRFGGNPLAVVLDAEGLSTAEMHAVAREFGYSETTFVLPPQDPRHTARVRIFTPGSELPFAGHPNVGTAYVLARQGWTPGPDGFVFEEGAGLVPMRLLSGPAGVTGAELRAPEALSRRSAASPEAAAACLSLPTSDLVVARHPPQVVSVGLPFLVVELASRDALARARPDLEAHKALLPLDGADSVFAYVREAEAEPAASANAAVLHARMFAPLDGIPEDPATGSATAAALGLLAAIAPSAPGERAWRVHQGDDMGRPSQLFGRTVAGADGAVTVYVGGACAPVFDGTFDL